jgi:hypothetical protein
MYALLEYHNPKKSKPLGNQLWNWPWPKPRIKGSYTDSTCQTQNYWSRKFDLAPYLATIIFHKYFRDPKSKGLPFLKNPRPKPPDSSCKKPRTSQHWYLYIYMEFQQMIWIRNNMILFFRNLYFSNLIGDLILEDWVQLAH